MAYRIIWSPLFRDDLREIVRFIALDSSERAAVFGYRLMVRTDQLQQFPESGRKVPKHENPMIRELILRPYRIIYRVDHEHNL